jgi:hypothetical protein
MNKLTYYLLENLFLSLPFAYFIDIISNNIYNYFNQSNGYQYNLLLFYIIIKTIDKIIFVILFCKNLLLNYNNIIIFLIDIVSTINYIFFDNIFSHNLCFLITFILVQFYKHSQFNYKYIRTYCIIIIIELINYYTLYCLHNN